MRSRDLSGLVPHLLSSVFYLFWAFSTLKKFWLWQFFSFFFPPPSATSVLRQSAANNQHILTGIIALCALLPASLWKPILEWIRQIHTCFLSPHPHPATRVHFGLLRHNCRSVCPIFFSCFSSFFLCTKSNRILQRAFGQSSPPPRKKGYKSLFYFCWKVEEPHKRLHVVRPEELNSRPEPCRRRTEGNGTERAKGHWVLNHNIMFNFSLNFACEKYAAVGLFYAQFTSDWTARLRKSWAQWLGSLWNVQRKPVIPLMQHVEGRLQLFNTSLCNTQMTADDKCVGKKRHKTCNVL